MPDSSSAEAAPPRVPAPGQGGLLEPRALVLLVDDQVIIGETVRRMLVGESDISLHYCGTGADAVRLAADLRPTVILQDLVLGDADGLDLVSAYRREPMTAAIPIIVLSTKEDPMVKSQAFERGANDYMVKVPDRAELIARIRYHSRAYLSTVQRDEAFRALKESQRQLVETNTALTALNQQLNRFVGMAAHDLRNPLGLVQGFAEFMLHDPTYPLAEQQTQFLASIHDSASFMLRLVNDLLDVSQIEAGKLTLDRRPTDLVALVESHVALNRILAGEKTIEIAVEADPDLPHVIADPHRIEQALTNLLTNAIKYSHPGTRVAVSVRRDGGEVVLAVHDQGQGIPAAELDRLFTPFGVTSVRGTGGEKSTGLGLLIVKKVVDAHGGRIWVTSEVGSGSSFFIALPLPSKR